MCLWDIETGRELSRLPGHGAAGGSRAVRFTPDGKGLFSWGDDRHLRRWDLATGKATHDYRLEPGGLKLPV